MTIPLKTHTKKFNISVIFLLFIFVINIIITSLNPIVTKAASTYVTPYNQAEIYNAKYILINCIYNDFGESDGFETKIKYDDVLNGDVFSNKDTIQVGKFFDDADGKVNCKQDGKLILEKAGITDFVKFFTTDTGILKQINGTSEFEIVKLKDEKASDTHKRFIESIDRYLNTLHPNPGGFLSSFNEKNGIQPNSPLSKAAAYFMLRENFIADCDITMPPQDALQQNARTINMVDTSTGALTESKFIFNSTKKMRYGYGVPPSDNPKWDKITPTANTEMKCEDALIFINNYAQDAKKDTETAIAAGAKTTLTDNQSTTVVQEKISCKKNVGIFGSAICYVLGWIDSALSKIESLIIDEFQVDTTLFDGDNQNADLRSVWNNIARLASGLLVLVALVMIISTALGFNVVSAYTVKKVLPRIVIGAIGIWLSWTLVTSYIDVMNTIGGGLQEFMYLAVGDSVDLDKFGLQTIISEFIPTSIVGKLETTVLFTGLAAAGISTLSLPLILGLALTALIGLFTGLAVLAIRQLIIVVLLIFSPLAFAAWILPNTNKYWSKWFSILNKLLIMYPLFAALFAAGKIIGYITLESKSGIFGVVIPVIAYLFPFYYLPKLFKSAGGILSGVTGAVNKAGNKVTGGWQNTIKGASEATKRRQAAEKAARQRQRQSTGKIFKRVKVPGLITASTMSDNFRRGAPLLRDNESQGRATNENITNAMKNLSEAGLDNPDVLAAIASGDTSNASAKPYINDKYAQAAATQMLASQGRANQAMIARMASNFTGDRTTAQRLTRQAIGESKNNGNLSAGSMEYNFSTGQVGHTNSSGDFKAFQSSPDNEYTTARNESIVRELGSQSFDERSRTLTKNTDFATGRFKNDESGNHLREALRTAPAGQSLVREITAPSTPGNENNHKVTQGVKDALNNL